MSQKMISRKKETLHLPARTVNKYLFFRLRRQKRARVSHTETTQTPHLRTPLFFMRCDNSLKVSDTWKRPSKVHEPINGRQWKRCRISLPDVREEGQLPVAGSLPAAPYPAFSTGGSCAYRKDAVNNSEP